MTLDRLLPYIAVRYVALDGTSKTGTRMRLFIDCDAPGQRERLYKYRDWRVTGIQASARFIHERLWGVLTVMVEEA